MTLVEMIAAMAIFTIIMGSVMVMFSTITNTVRRGYRTMDLFEATHGALMTIERDIQSAFSAPAIGADFHFYGEPNGFIFVGIAPDGKLGRLTYAVHADTSRMEAPGTPDWRGERVTLPVKRSNIEGDFPDFSLYYPGPDEYVDAEIEVVYGLLVRYYERDVNHIERFDGMAPFLNDIYPYALASENSFLSEEYPFSAYLQEKIVNAAVPWYVWDKLKIVEHCHYWLQMLQGPIQLPVVQWDPLYIWWQTQDEIFWFDHRAPVLPSYQPNLPTENRRFLWDHVVAKDFVITNWLLDPGNGNRLPVSAVTLDPVFEYSVESGLGGGDKTSTFNTIFNLDRDGGEVASLTQKVMTATENPDIDAEMEAMVTYRDLYNLGNPLQSRIPSAFDINLFVISPPITTGAPTDVFTFSQTIHIPSGFLRRNLAID